MAFHPRFHVCLFILFTLPTFSLSLQPKPTVYDILPEYGLPRGIFPDSVESYNLSKDGSFEVILKSPCYVEFEYLVHYADKITGKLSIGSLTELKGIEVKRILFWFNVNEIRVDLPPSDNVYFQIGFINKRLDMSQFQTIHSCMDNVFSIETASTASSSYR